MGAGAPYGDDNLHKGALKMTDFLREILKEMQKIAPESIKDINDQYDYEDTNSGGTQDGTLVSCGQCGGYNELEYIYEKKLEPFIKSNEITEKQAINALNACCAELKNPRKRNDFYTLLSKKLNVKVSS